VVDFGAFADRHPVKYARAVTTLTIALRKVIAAEPDITNYDTVVGDGDCGIGLKRGSEGMSHESMNILI
jgi:hypothetical protein